MADKLIDTQRYLLCASIPLVVVSRPTGPASIQAQARHRPFGATVEDIANSALILAHLDVEQVHTVVGFTGATASFALMHPERCQRLRLFGSRSQPHAIVTFIAARNARTDPLWNQGNYDLAQHGPVNVRLRASWA